MKPELRRVGNSQSPVVVIDDFSGAAEDIARIADALAPYPPITSNYLSRRPPRHHAPPMPPPTPMSTRLAAAAAQFIGGAFDVDGFDLDRSELLDRDAPAARSAAHRNGCRISIHPTKTSSHCSIILRVPDKLRNGLLPPSLDGHRTGDRTRMLITTSRSPGPLPHAARRLAATSTARTNITSRSAPSKPSPTG